MKRLNLYLFFLLYLLFLSCKTFRLVDAEDCERRGEYFTAVDLYRKVYNRTSTHKKDRRGGIAFRMGECYFKMNRPSQAIQRYLHAVRYQYTDPIVFLKLAQSYQKTGNYEEAKKFFLSYLSFDPESQVCRNGLAGIDSALVWKDESSEYVIKKVSFLGASYGAFSPMYYSKYYNQVYFTGSRLKNTKRSPVTGGYPYSIFSSGKEKNGEWGKAVEVQTSLHEVYENGTPSFSPDGKKMYYTSCKPDELGDFRVGIYLSKYVYGEWSAGVPVLVSDDFFVVFAHPAVSPDGKYLYFVSNLSGGCGGKDMYRALIVGNGIGKIEHLGEGINTEGDELFPYVWDSQTLYFASDGHPGLGGLDIFKATLQDDGKWSVKNMGAPFNSCGDDFGIVFEGIKEKGLFSSNRDSSTGIDQIYFFEIPKSYMEIEGVVMDFEENPLPYAILQIIGSNGVNKRLYVGDNGDYKIVLEEGIDYIFMASAHGFLNQYISLLYEPNREENSFCIDFFLSPYESSVVLDDIFYATNQYTLTTKSLLLLNQLLEVIKENTDLLIKVHSHTDRKGSQVYNDRLSVKRAHAVVEFLLDSGIERNRIVSYGHGKEEPREIEAVTATQYPFLKVGDVLTEGFVEKLPFSQQLIADQLNRRTEIRLVHIEK